MADQLPKVGDRVSLTGTVRTMNANDWLHVHFDGCPPEAYNFIRPEAMAKATILPREWKVGDEAVFDNFTKPFRIEVIVGDEAALSQDGVLHFILNLARLRRPEQKGA